jgi:hypothetical protein
MSEPSTMTRPGGNQAGLRAGAFALLSPARPRLPRKRGLYLATVVMRIVGAGLLALIGYIHWHLWQEGYEFIHVSGPLFLVDAVAGVVLAVAILAWARPLTGTLSTGFNVVTIAALVISLAVGLFGFHESIHAAYVVESLIIESIAAIVLGTWTVIAAVAVARRS